MPATRDGVANKNFSLRCSFCSRPVDPTLPEKKLGPRLMRYAGILKIKPLMQIFRVCSTDNFLSQIFSPSLSFGHVTLRVSGASSQQRKLLFVYLYFLGIFFLFFAKKKCVFIIFIPFFDKVSNFRNRMLTSQKPEQVIRICQ